MQPEIAETCRLRASIAKMKTKEMHSAEEKNQHKTSEFITWSRLSLERIENFPKQTISYIKGLYTPHYVENWDSSLYKQVHGDSKILSF